MWRDNEIVDATKGTHKGAKFEASSVTIDSRKIQKNALFVAIKGERVDGHDYVKDALARGASAALVERIPEGLKADASIIVVDDTYKALVDMAVAVRRRTNAKIIAVTGSVGKTGMKEAILAALASAGVVYATQGNLNNHIGLPLSLVNLPRDANFGVFEMGMNHAGEISFLTRVARPDVAVITNVEAVHLEFFSDVAAIADAKAEIMEGMPSDGTIILNRDNRFYDRLLEHAHKHQIENIVTFGAHVEAQCRLVSYALNESGSQIEAVIHGMPITYRLGTIGKHWAFTSLAALAVITAVGVDLADSAAAFTHFREPDGRGRLHRVMVGKTPIILIDDCYNASPISMTAGLSKLAELHDSIKTPNRKIAVIGDMLELGISGIEYHKELFAPLQQYNIDKVYAAGVLMKNLYDILPAEMQGAYAPNAKELAELVKQSLQAEDIVLIKGSHGSRMDIVRDVLMVPAQNKMKESVDAL